MKKAFIFGKFLPFHKGHEAMIEFAINQCDLLTVLVCCSDKENLSCAIRSQWISKTFDKHPTLQVRCLDYQEFDLENSSESSREISRKWSAKFKEVLPDHSLLVTSEPYGEYVAEYMGISHIAFDLKRTKHLISATEIRNDLFKSWDYLPDSVKEDLALKVVLLGTESTGKSTLTQMLSTHFKCSSVEEAGRDIIPDSKSFSFEDLFTVARVHRDRTIAACRKDSPLVIIDTDIHITKSYARFTFNRNLEGFASLQNFPDRTLYLYLCNDVPYVQDGTRLTKQDRDLLDQSHREQLMDEELSVIEVAGEWKHRFETAVEAIESFLLKHRRLSFMS